MIPPSEITIAVPPGIGDALWSMTKILAIKALHPGARIVVVAQNTRYNRSEFLERFDFVDEVRYAEMTITESPRVREDGSYNYIESGRNVRLGGRTYDYWLQANGDLERGGTLDDWFPELDTDWGIADHWEQRKEDYAIFERLPFGLAEPYVVLYLGPESGNTDSTKAQGQNRGALWRVVDWVNLAHQLLNDYGLPVVLVGADWEQDRDYAAAVLEAMPRKLREQVHDLVGQTTVGECFALCRHAQVMVGYPAGVTIFSAWLGTRTVTHHRAYGNSINPATFVSFHDEMVRNFVPPRAHAEGAYLPLVYGRSTVGSIIRDMERRGWLPERLSHGLNGRATFAPEIDHVPAHAWTAALERNFLKTMDVPGDVLEVGCCLGGCSLRMAALLREHGKSRKRVGAIDTFEGFADDDPHPDGATKAGKYSPPYDAYQYLWEVGRELNLIPSKGDARDLLPAIPGTYRLSFALLDTDYEETITLGLESFRTRMAPGGILAVDDYGRPECPGALVAVNHFLRAYPEWRVVDLDPHAFQVFLQEADRA